jgi:hypothetical protein
LPSLVAALTGETPAIVTSGVTQTVKAKNLIARVLMRLSLRSVTADCLMPHHVTPFRSENSQPVTSM